MSAKHPQKMSSVKSVISLSTGITHRNRVDLVILTFAHSAPTSSSNRDEIAAALSTDFLLQCPRFIFKTILLYFFK